MPANHSKPPYLRVARGPVAPFVVTCEHARPALPPGVRTVARERDLLRSHWGWDIGAWDLSRAIARRLGSGATGGRWSRLWIDLNRPPTDETLVRRSAEGHAFGWNRGLTPREIARRYDTVHSPYHREVDREIVRRLLRGVRPLLLAVHTYTPELNGRRRTYEAGVLYDEHRGPARTLVRALRGTGLEVRYNEPYSGRRGLMYSIDRHGREHGLPCLELEINQSMFERRRATEAIASAVADGMREIEARSRGRR